MSTTPSPRTKYEPTPVRCDGIDSDWFHFSIQSRTRKGLRHEMHVDRRTGVVSCSCEDARYRKKRGDVMDLDGPNLCWHLRRLMHEFKAVLS